MRHSEIRPGSPSDGYLPHRRGVDEDGRGAPLEQADPPPDGEFVPVLVAAGHAIVLDVPLIHRSPCNTAGEPRVALNACFMTLGSLPAHLPGLPHLYVPIRQSKGARA